jgi:hypothetical protein
MVNFKKYPLADRFLKETGMSIDQALLFFEKIEKGLI